MAAVAQHQYAAMAATNGATKGYSSTGASPMHSINGSARDSARNSMESLPSSTPQSTSPISSGVNPFAKWDVHQLREEMRCVHAQHNDLPTIAALKPLEPIGDLIAMGSADRGPKVRALEGLSITQKLFVLRACQSAKEKCAKALEQAFHPLNAALPRRRYASSPAPRPIAPEATGRNPEHGFVGIRNQGSTCYLNSLLQMLFHLIEFRRAIYHMPTEDENESTSSVPLALQKLFVNLQVNDGAAETTELTQSFGWSASDAFVQHDIHELTMILLDNLEKKMTKPGEPNPIKELFRGELENYFNVPSADYSSAQTEFFYDLQLVVKDCATIYDSFDLHFKPEILDGTNKYCIERDGEKTYHEAEKGIRFKRAPPVLLLQLTRFDFDFKVGDLTKVLTKWEYYDTIDLQQYLPNGGEDAGGATYKLHSVLVHVGSDARFGHYYCYVKCGAKWLQFNDEVVKVVEANSVFGSNFGGVTRNYWGNEVPNTCNGYMLVYVRESAADKIMRPLADSDLPQHLIDRLKHDAEDAERRKKEKSEEHLYVRVTVFTPQDVCDHPTLLTSPMPVADEKFPSYRLPKKLPLRCAAEACEAELGIPVEHQMWWLYVMRPSGHFRLEGRPAMDDEMHDVFRCREYRTTKDARAYITDRRTTLVEGGDTTNAADASVILTHHKYYDARSEKYIALGSIVVAGVAAHPHCLESLAKRLLSEVDPEAAKDLGLRSLSPVLLSVNGHAAPVPADVSPGDIYVWEHPLSTEDERSLDHPTAQSYLRFLTCKVAVNFLLNEAPNYPQKFKLELEDDLLYYEVQDRVARYLNAQDASAAVNPDKVRFTRQDLESRQPSYARLRAKDRPSLRTMLSSQQQVMGDSLYYEVGEYTVSEIETSNALFFDYFNEHVKFVSSHVVLLPPQGKFTVGEMLEACLEKVAEANRPSGPVRLVDAWKGRIYTTYESPSLTFTDRIQDSADYRLEPLIQPPSVFTVNGNGNGETSATNSVRGSPVPPDGGGPGDRPFPTSPGPSPPKPTGKFYNNGGKPLRVDAFHVYRNSGKFSCHSDPFSVYLLPDEHWDEFTLRLAEHLAITHDALKSWKAHILCCSPSVGPLAVASDRPLMEYFRTAWKANPTEAEKKFYLGLEHPPPPSHHRSQRREERALKIYN